MIDLPSPFAPPQDWRMFLIEMQTLDLSAPEVMEAIGEAKQMIASLEKQNLGR